MSRIIIFLFILLNSLTASSEEVSNELNSNEDITSNKDFRKAIRSLHLADGTTVAVIPNMGTVGLYPAAAQFNGVTSRKMEPMYVTEQMKFLISRIEKLEEKVQIQSKVIKLLAKEIKDQ